MIDLSKQKTFHSDFKNPSKVNSFTDNSELFLILCHLDGDCRLFYWDDFSDDYQEICNINSLEELEIEYNKRTLNDVFEWK